MFRKYLSIIRWNRKR